MILLYWYLPLSATWYDKKIKQKEFGLECLFYGNMFLKKTINEKTIKAYKKKLNYQIKVVI